MALLNFGVIPGGASGNELAALTRRAFMPSVVVQIGKASPYTTALLAAAEPVSGGVSPITQPIQGTRMVAGAWTDYSGAFTAPQVLTGLINAEYNLKAFVVGIPYYLFEGFVQQDADIVPLLWARMNDAGNYTSDQISLAIFAALSANTALQPWSLNDIIATTNPTQGNVGNIDRVANTFWQANVSTIAALNAASSAWSRTNLLAAITFAQKKSGGEAPSAIFLSPGAWMAVAADVIGSERYVTASEGAYAEAGEGVEVAFPALNVANVPIFMDLYQTDNTVAQIPNFNYLQFKLHQDASFVVLGPESLLPQFQLGYIMVLLVLLEQVCSKASAQTQVTGFTGAYTI